MTMATTDIRNHPNYDASDYAYLTAKGWSQAQIIERWNIEHAAGKGPCTWESEGARIKLANTLRNAADPQLPIKKGNQP